MRSYSIYYKLHTTHTTGTHKLRLLHKVSHFNFFHFICFVLVLRFDDSCSHRVILISKWSLKKRSRVYSITQRNIALMWNQAQIERIRDRLLCVNCVVCAWGMMRASFLRRVVDVFMLMINIIFKLLGTLFFYDMTKSRAYFRSHSFVKWSS